MLVVVLPEVLNRTVPSQYKSSPLVNCRFPFVLGIVFGFFFFFVWGPQAPPIDISGFGYEVLLLFSIYLLTEKLMRGAGAGFANSFYSKMTWTGTDGHEFDSFTRFFNIIIIIISRKFFCLFPEKERERESE